MMILILMLSLMLAAPQAGEPLNLSLVCSGMGSQVKPDVDTDTAYDNQGHSATITRSASRDVAFGDDVRIDIIGTGGRIRVPQTMLPPIRGGKDGWFELHDVRASADEITGVATINLFNKVKLRLDRLTGQASFTVLHGQFSGRCTPFDPATVRRAF